MKCCDLLFQLLTAVFPLHRFLQRLRLARLGAERVTGDLPHKIFIYLIDAQTFYLQRRLVFREPVRVVVGANLKSI